MPAKMTKTKVKTKTKAKASKKVISAGSDFFDILWERSWTYIKTVVDVVREPMVILDSDYKVMAANEPFCDTFKVPSSETENKRGQGQ